LKVGGPLRKQRVRGGGARARTAAQRKAEGREGGREGDGRTDGRGG
jgi:hypothetical protein